MTLNKKLLLPVILGVTGVVLGILGLVLHPITAGSLLNDQLRIEYQIQKLTVEKKELQSKRDGLVAKVRSGTFTKSQ